MASNALLHKTSLCAGSKFKIDRSHRPGSDFTASESEGDDISSKSSSNENISVAKISQSKREPTIPASNLRKRQHTNSHIPAQDMKSEKSGDSFLFEHAKNVLKEKCMEMAELKNEIVDLNSTEAPLAADNSEARAKRRDGQITRDALTTPSACQKISNNVAKKDMETSENCTGPKLLYETLESKPDYIPLAWQEMSLQNGIDPTGSCALEVSLLKM